MQFNFLNNKLDLDRSFRLVNKGLTLKVRMDTFFSLKPIEKHLSELLQINKTSFFSDFLISN